MSDRWKFLKRPNEDIYDVVPNEVELFKYINETTKALVDNIAKLEHKMFLKALPTEALHELLAQIKTELEERTDDNK